MAQSVERPTSARVMISQFMGLSPASGSVLTAYSLEPALSSVSPSLSAPPLLTLCLYLSKINKLKVFKNKQKQKQKQKPKTVIRDEEGHYIIIKGTIQQEDVTIVNINAPNMEATK